MILIIIIIIKILYSFISVKKITYYKCSSRPNSKLLHSVFENNKINRQIEGFDLYMPCGYNEIEREMSDNIFYGKYIFGLKGCDSIVSKNSLWLILENTFGRSAASNIMPETYVFDNNEQTKMAYNSINKGNILICKKNVQRKMGLKIAKTIEDLKDCEKEKFKVAQLFMKNTLTIKGHKINLRIYYVIKKERNKLSFYLYNNGKILYTNKKTGGEVTFDTHITSYQMDSNIYKKEGLPHNLIDLKKYIGNDYKQIWNKIKQKMMFLSKAISYVFNDELHYNKVCFQLFGVDVIIDENKEPYILEINKGPDMIPKCDADIELKKRVYEDTMRIGGVIGFKIRKNGFYVIHRHYF